jgi:hypothetical protein
MALDTFIAGRYSGAYGPTGSLVDVGLTGQGYEIQQDSELDDIGETDMFGMTVIDAIFRGGNCHIQFESLTYKAGSLTCYWPYGGALGGVGVLGTLWDTTALNGGIPPGQLASNIAMIFTLSPTTGTPALPTAAGGGFPKSLTANLALLAKNNNARLLFNSKLRTVPIRMRLYPYTTGTSPNFKYVWFTTT